ncbi:hypothetical protein GIX10_03890 [Acinetobacter sp. YIM 103518]|uniref:Uncharacterized protein n=1 Tax=Acinetobacter faecalis TaxID=2665161 RepID=A0A6L6GDN7_9GAMM|nr:hypothetical protein [Acinetobacter faecalis]MTD10595.1 hypothetical protein [Acinetobacter faecalis]
MSNNLLFDYIDNIESNLAVNVKKTLTEYDIWYKNDTLVWKADSFEGRPQFYPIYQYQNYYSYSPLALIFFKKNLNVNRAFLSSLDKNENFYSGEETIDKDIRRIGGAISFTKKIRKESEAVEKITEALIKDVIETENNYPNFVNIILCGGKDSLNLLLLPWSNPVLVVSAEPNYSLVVEFIKENNLDYKIEVLLDEENLKIKNKEILINTCLMDLRHARWGAALVEISNRYDTKAIFWLGQGADAFTTPNWKSFFHNTSTRKKRLNKLRQVFGLRLINQTPEGFANAMWSRIAMWQGVHTSFMRALTGCLVLSAYHGREMSKVLVELDLNMAIQRDIRSIIGEKLFGKQVKYPAINPGPQVSEFRAGLHQPQLFFNQMEKLENIKVIT